MNKNIFTAIGLITVLGLLGMTTLHFVQAVPKECAGNPHFRDATTGNPHDQGESGNPHDVGGHGDMHEFDACPGSK